MNNVGYELIGPGKNKTKYLVFLEFIDEADVFLAKYLNEIKSTADEFIIISFHPLVKAHLLKHQIEAVDSFHFCPTASHQKLICVLEEFTEQVRSECRLKDSHGVGNSYVENLIFYLRTILSLWLYQIEVMSNAIDYYQPITVISVGQDQPDVVKNAWVDNHERFLANIAAQICDAKKILLKHLPVQIASKNPGKKISEWSKRIVGDIFFSVLHRMTKPEKNLIIAPAIAFQMGEVLKDLKHELGDDYKLSVIDLPYKLALRNVFGYFTNDRLPYTYLPCHKNKKVNGDNLFIEQKNKFRGKLFKTIEKWSYSEVFIGPWIKRKYQHSLESEIIDKTYGYSYNLNKYLDKWKPAFVITQYSRMFAAVLSDLCNLKKIPSMIIPHGSFAPVHDEYSKKEWRENAPGQMNTEDKYVALQTPLAEKFLSDIPSKCKPVITGPLLFGRAIKKSADIRQFRRQYTGDEDIIILHAGTPKSRSGCRLLNYETLDEYVDGMVSLVNTISKLKKVHLILRYRPIDGLSPESLKKLLPVSDSCCIASDGIFSDYLSMSDLLVSFSSTTIEEALQNNIPALLFNKYNRYQHIIGTELSSKSTDISPAAIYNVNSEDNLLFALKWIQTNHLLKKINKEKLFSEYKYPESETIKLSEFIKGVLKPFNGKQ